MTTEERNKKLEEALKDESFEKELSGVKNEEDLKKVFSNRGIEVTSEEISDIISQAAQGETGELDEDALEEVSGGMLSPRWVWRIARWLLKGHR